MRLLRVGFRVGVAVELEVNPCAFGEGDAHRA
jgi:hypothetical protein